MKKKRLKVGSKIRVTKRYIKWMNTHLWDIFSAAGKIDSYHEDILMWVMADKENKPIYGKITGYGDDCYRCRLETVWGYADDLIEEKNLRKV